MFDEMFDDLKESRVEAVRRQVNFKVQGWRGPAQPVVISQQRITAENVQKDILSFIAPRCSSMGKKSPFNFQ